MTDHQISEERDQLIGHWKKAIAKRQDWTTFSQIKNLVSIANGNPSSRSSTYPVRDLLREFHNELGYKALNGGLCAGAIFRTQSFIDTRPRVGSRNGQTVHIEHTVPICVLETKLRHNPLFDDSETLVWLLKYSVVTAFRKGDEKKYLKGVTKKTNALDPNSTEFDKPFLRYKQLFDANDVVWNVFDKKEIVPDRFTFGEHIDLIIRLMSSVGAEQRLIKTIERLAFAVDPFN